MAPHRQRLHSLRLSRRWRTHAPSTRPAARSTTPEAIEPDLWAP
ncbi:MAG: hypothetical protein ACKN89_12195 [Cyanobium sp.]